MPTIFSASKLPDHVIDLFNKFHNESGLLELTTSCGFVEFPNGRIVEIQLTAQADDDQLILDPEEHPVMVLKKSQFPMNKSKNAKK